MDQVHVEAPVASAQAASLEREFYSDFPLVLNYVARLVDDIDGGVGDTCAAFRQDADNLRHRRNSEGLRRGHKILAGSSGHRPRPHTHPQVPPPGEPQTDYKEATPL